MARKKRRYLREGATYQETIQPHPKTGVNTTFAVLPLDQLVEEYSDAVTRKKIRIRDRIFNWFRGEAGERTSLAPDERSTQMGAVTFGDLGVSSGFYERTRLEHVRRAKYRDFDRMDAEGTVGERALTVTVNNAFLSEDGDQDSYAVDSKDSRALNIIKDLEERTGLKDDAPGMMRTGLKYGDSFEELCFDVQKRLIVRLNWLNPMHTDRVEDEYGRPDATRAFVQKDSLDNDVVAFHFWQVVHTRYNHRRGNRYGTSFYESPRRPYKIRHVMEEGVALNRISRAVDRIAFYIPVPKSSAQFEKDKIIADAKKRFRKRVAVDSEGKMDLTRAPFGDAEDIFIGVEGKDSAAKVEMLKGTTILGQLGDVEYFLNMEIMGYGVPKSYLQLERDVSCFALDTKIPCLDGETRTLDQIITEYEDSGNLPWVYSWDKDSGKIVPGQVEWAGVTRRNAEVIEVVLDDGTVHRCTPDHKWFALDGQEIKAEDLHCGVQLLPLRRAIRKSISYNGYEKIYDPYGGVELTHRRVAETVMADEFEELEQPNVHHKDGNKQNNDPRNLSVIEFVEHLQKHSIDRFEALTRYRKKNGAWNKGAADWPLDDPRRESLGKTTYITKSCLVCCKTFKVPLVKKKKVVCSRECAGVRSGIFRDNSQIINCHNCGEVMRVKGSLIGQKKYCSRYCKSAAAYEVKPCEYCGEDFRSRKKLKQRFCCQTCSNSYGNKKRAGLLPLPNHTVVAVRWIPRRREDTGDITVGKYSNFFIADSSGGGVLVHNSKATLGHEDIEFGRMIQIHRKRFSKFLREVYKRQIVALTGAPPKADAITITWPAISFIDQKMRVEVELLKWQIATLAKQSFGVPTPWLLSEIIGLDDDDIGEIEAGMQEPAQGAQPGAFPIGGPGSMAANPEMTRADREAAKAQFFNDRRLAAEVHELRDLITQVRAFQLDQTMAA